MKVTRFVYQRIASPLDPRSAPSVPGDDYFSSRLAPYSTVFPGSSREGGFFSMAVGRTYPIADLNRAATLPATRAGTGCADSLDGGILPAPNKSATSGLRRTINAPMPAPRPNNHMNVQGIMASVAAA